MESVRRCLLKCFNNNSHINLFRKLVWIERENKETIWFRNYITEIILHKE